MSISEIFSSSPNEEDIKKKIVEQLLNNENLDTKTELGRPLRWACMNSLSEFLIDHNLNKSNEILGNFMFTSFKYLISFKRQGRKEYIEALKSLSEYESNPNEEDMKRLRMLPKK